MNEIIGPLYYIFASDPDVNWRGTIRIHVVVIDCSKKDGCMSIFYRYPLRA